MDELKIDKEEIITVLDEILANVKIEVWIGKEDKMIYKIVMKGKFDQEFAEKMKKIEKEKKYSYVYKVESDLKNITIIDLKNNKKQLKKINDFLKD